MQDYSTVYKAVVQRTLTNSKKAFVRFIDGPLTGKTLLASESMYTSKRTLKKGDEVEVLFYTENVYGLEQPKLRILDIQNPTADKEEFIKLIKPQIHNQKEVERIQNTTIKKNQNDPPYLGPSEAIPHWLKLPLYIGGFILLIYIYGKTDDIQGIAGGIMKIVLFLVVAGIAILVQSSKK